MNDAFRPATRTFLVGIFLLLVAASSTLAAKPKAKPICADDSGVFLALATDEDSYSTVEGSKGDEEHGLQPQNWVLTAEPTIDPMSGESPKGPQHSYDGRFLQVL
eukprot:CAMPEP_0197191434 /NCGR_PEP_ID=MMETSP1423-20130617/23388_1 /TAXON_ID=476441 /ORGANISM="Pseudo-nitzschia heimii, Strain UNC1101" /LENGTH=104 /DNA_ID=CAMNT_0042644065 /DNA_START=46 /DNA_END=356 /DNA_ORIENTATION=+